MKLKKLKHTTQMPSKSSFPSKICLFSEIKKNLIPHNTLKSILFSQKININVELNLESEIFKTRSPNFTSRTLSPVPFNKVYYHNYI